MRRMATTLAVAALAAGCHTPLVTTEAGSYTSEETAERDVSSRPGVVRQVLLYVPNRVVDLLDVVHTPVLGINVGLGFDLRITRWGQLAAMVGAGAAVGWDDRSHDPFWSNLSATAGIGPFRTGAGLGTAPSIGDWEIAIAAPAMKIAIDLAEIADFVLGWVYLDILRDDYGWE